MNPKFKRRLAAAVGLVCFALTMIVMGAKPPILYQFGTTNNATDLTNIIIAIAGNATNESGTADMLWIDDGTAIYPSGVEGTNNGWIALGSLLYPENTSYTMNIVPNAAKVGSVGTASRKFSAMYATNFYGSGANLTGIGSNSFDSGTWSAIVGGESGTATNIYTWYSNVNANAQSISNASVIQATNFYGTFVGDGSGLTSLNGTNITNGTVETNALSAAAYAALAAGGGNATATNLADGLSATNLTLVTPNVVGSVVLTNPVVDFGAAYASRMEFTNGGDWSTMQFTPVTDPARRQGIFFSGLNAGDSGIWYWPNHGGDSMLAPELLITSRGSMAFSTGNYGGSSSGASSRGIQWGIAGAWHNYHYMQGDSPGNTWIDGGDTNYAMSIPILFKPQYWTNGAWYVAGAGTASSEGWMPGMVGRATGTNGDGAISFYDKFNTGFDTWGYNTTPRFEVLVSPSTARGGININGGITINGATGLTTNYAMNDGNTLSYSNGVLVSSVATPAYWDTDAAAYLTRIGSMNESLDLAINVNSFVKALKTANVWTNLAALYLFPGANADTNGQNLISQNYTIAWSGTWGTNNAEGIHGAIGGNAYGNTGFTNNATNGSAFIYVKAASTGSGGVFFGVQQDGGFAARKIYLLDQAAAYGLGTFSSYAAATVWYPTWPSSVMLQRSGTANVDYFSGGGSTKNSTAVAVTDIPSGLPIYIGCLHNQGSPALYSLAHIQAFALTTNVITGTQYAALHAAVESYNAVRASGTWGDAPSSYVFTGNGSGLTNIPFATNATYAVHSTNFWGLLSVTNYNSGTDASAATYLRGDGTWASVTNGVATNVFASAAGTGIAIETNSLVYTISTTFDTNGLATTNWVGANYQTLALAATTNGFIGAHAFTNHTDVLGAALTSGDVLAWDNSTSKWTNGPPVAVVAGAGLLTGYNEWTGSNTWSGTNTFNTPIVAEGGITNSNGYVWSFAGDIGVKSILFSDLPGNPATWSLNQYISNSGAMAMGSGSFIVSALGHTFAASYSGGSESSPSAAQFPNGVAIDAITVTNLTIQSNAGPFSVAAPNIGLWNSNGQSLWMITATKTNFIGGTAP